MKFNTKTIHGGQHPEPQTGAVMPPVFLTSTYAQKRPGEHKGYEYSRGANPTRAAFERNIASLENGTHGFAFASGLAAVDAILRLLAPGDEVITSKNIYGGTYRMFTQLFQKQGIRFSFIDFEDISDINKHISKKTRLVWLETPTNPLLTIVDIKRVAHTVKNVHPEILVAVDNTFATPYLQQPLDLGADIVMHSVTKYLGGHSDLMMGAVVVKEETLVKDIHFVQYAAGAIAGPMDCFLALRGIKTLHVRMDRHCENAKTIADFLVDHPKVGKVYYPGLTSHPNHKVAANQMNNFGGMLSFRFQNDCKDEAVRFLERLQIFTLAESLGGVESLANYSASMTHASVPREERLKMGISDSMIRLSVGIEDINDLLEDLKFALDF